jgi:hypothetical protein
MYKGYIYTVNLLRYMYKVNLLRYMYKVNLLRYTLPKWMDYRLFVIYKFKDDTMRNFYI